MKKINSTKPYINDTANPTDIWDSLPLFISKHEMSKLRDKKRNLTIRKFNQAYCGANISVEIHRALIEEINSEGNLIDCSYFPSKTEEIILNVLRRLQNSPPEHNMYYVNFTLVQIQTELACSGHTLSIEEICKGLEILARCIVIIKGDGINTVQDLGNVFLSNLTIAKLNDPSMEQNLTCSATLHPLSLNGKQILEFRTILFE